MTCYFRIDFCEKRYFHKDLTRCNDSICIRKNTKEIDSMNGSPTDSTYGSPTESTSESPNDSTSEYPTDESTSESIIQN